MLFLLFVDISSNHIQLILEGFASSGMLRQELGDVGDALILLFQTLAGALLLLSHQVDGVQQVVLFFCLLFFQLSEVGWNLFKFDKVF